MLLWMLTKYILLIILSPILAYVSEKTESIIQGKNYPLDLGQILKDAVRGSIIAMRNLAIEIGILVSLFIATFFAPFLGPFTAILSFAVGAYFYGYSMIDYIAERKRLSISDSHKFVQHYMGVALALGVLISVGIVVPILGFIAGAFMSIIAAVAAVLVIEPITETKPPSPKSQSVVTLKKVI